MSVSFCLPHPVAVSAFMICRGLCACTEMLWMCVLYVSFRSKVRPRTFGCVAMGSALLAPNETAYKRWSCHSGLKHAVQIVSNLPAPIYLYHYFLLGFPGSHDILEKISGSIHT